MAVLRRRNLGSTGSGLLEALTGQLGKHREQQMEMQQLEKKAALERQAAMELLGMKSKLEGEQSIRGIIAKAQAEAAAKQLYPEPLSPKEANEQRVGELAAEAGEVPEPMGGYNQAEVNADIPMQVKEAARQRELAILQRMMGHSVGSTNPVNVYSFDPDTGETIISAGGENLPPGSRVLPKRVTAEQAGAVTGAREQARINAQTDPGNVSKTADRAAAIKSAEAAAAPGLDKTTAVISAESSLRSIDELRSTLKDPKALLARGIPGIPGARDIERVLKNLELEIVTARGGKALTPSERELIRAVFPDKLDALDAMIRNDPTVIEDKLMELEVKANSLIGRVPVRADGSAKSKSDAAKSRLRAKYGR